MVAHLQDALAAAVADPDACTARCLARLAEEGSRAEQPSWHVEACCCVAAHPDNADTQHNALQVLARLANEEVVERPSWPRRG